MLDPRGFYEGRAHRGRREWITLRSLVERAAAIAHFWHMPPFEVMALPIEDLLLLEDLAGQLIDKQKH